ncbi:MAG: hypothetical protein ABIS18_03040 [Actinomycetota bacterium]
MRRVLVVLSCVGLLAGACARTDPSAPQTRTVLADFSHDEFSSFFLDYFPGRITVRPGDTVEFKQTWTGEPHSVTAGTLVDTMMNLVKPYKEAAERGEELPKEEPPEVEASFQSLPWMFADEDKIAQNGAQPCYLQTGTPPKDTETPCKQVPQPAFNGKQSYYHSGFIPYEGPKGNKFSAKMSDDIKPGIYNYYCNLHGPFMSAEIEIKAKGSAIPSQDEVNRKARKEIEKASSPLRKEFRNAGSKKLAPKEQERTALVEAGVMKEGELLFTGNLAGVPVDGPNVQAGINEFVPRTIKAKVGQKVSWTQFGRHTISFDVPKYFPSFSIAKGGKVVINPKLTPPAGGSPEVPEQPHGEGPSKPPVIDGGTWDGKGFFSSGLIAGDPFLVYSLRFSKPGKYVYACLIHPPMVGTVEVS